MKYPFKKNVHSRLDILKKLKLFLNVFVFFLCCFLQIFVTLVHHLSTTNEGEKSKIYSIIIDIFEKVIRIKVVDSFCVLL